MRVLHVSDWHLGRTTYKESRASDHDAVLAEIIGLARTERPDLICHTGDLFDQARPSYPDMVRGIAALQDLAAVAPVVVVAGNHDSPMLFTVFGQLLGPGSRIHFVPEPCRPSDGGVLRFPGADGTTLRLGVLPFVHANRIVNAFDDPEDWRGVYADRVGKMEQEIAAGLLDNFDDRNEVAMFAAHLYVGGANLSGSENHITGYYATNVDCIPSLAYAAFGHIHKPQPLATAQLEGRYAGSPLQLDFGEAGEQKSVVLVDVRPGWAAEVNVIDLAAGRRLRRFDGTIEELRRMAPTVDNELCLITISTSTHDPTLSDKVRDLLPKAVVVQLTEKCADRKLDIVTEESVADDAEPDIQQLFHDYLVDQGTKGAAADRVLQTFTDLLASVVNNDVPMLAEEELLTMPIDFCQTSATSEEPS